jgi:hypothetical protein
MNLVKQRPSVSLCIGRREGLRPKCRAWPMLYTISTKILVPASPYTRFQALGRSTGAGRLLPGVEIGRGLLSDRQARHASQNLSGPNIRMRRGVVMLGTLIGCCAACGAGILLLPRRREL